MTKGESNECKSEILANKLTSKNIDHKDYITLASVIAAFSVMLLHTNNCFWWLNVNDSRWAFANFLDALFYFAAPVYFMISGATLINYNERCSTGKYFLRRAIKILPAYFAWNFIALLYQSFYKKTTVFSDVHLFDFIKGTFNSSYLGIYWFLPSIICVYLFLPLFAAVEKEKRKKIFTYFVLLCLICNKLIPMILNILKIDFPWPFQEQGTFLNYIVYAILGYLISEYDEPDWMRYTIYGLAIIAFFVMWIGTFFDSRRIGSASYMFKGYEKFFSYLYASGIFLVIKKYGNKIMKVESINWLVTKMSKYTFATYLMHWYLMEFFIDIFHSKWYTQLFNVMPVDPLTIGGNLFYRLFTPFLLYAVVMGITWVLRKIPIVKYIVP